MSESSPRSNQDVVSGSTKYEEGSCQSERYPDESISGSQELETPTANTMSESCNNTNSEEEEAALAQEFEALHASSVTERRNFDYLINRLNARFARLEGQKSKAQNETGELVHSARNLLSKISDIESNLQVDSNNEKYIEAAGVRGPPLPSQSDMFMLAYEKGQVSQSYSKFNQRQWSAQKTSYPRQQY